MAAEKILIVNGQEMVPVNEARMVEPAQRYYYVQQAPSTPVQVAVQPGTVYLQPGYYVQPQPQPVAPIVVYPPSNDGGMIVAVFLALLVLLIAGFSAMLILAWIATGKLPWFGY